MSMQINSVSERLVYNNAKRTVSKAFGGYDPKRFKLTQSYLRLEQTLVTTNTNYTYPIINNQGGPQFILEKRLNLQDSFVVSSIQFYLAKTTGVDDATYRKVLYPNPAIFTNAVAMTAAWNSNLTLMVDQNQFIPAWDIERHMKIPQTQQTADPGAGSPLDEYEADVDGFYPVEPNLILVGSKNLVLNIVLPTSLTAVDANTRMGLTIRGVLVQNSTSVN